MHKLALIAIATLSVLGAPSVGRAEDALDAEVRAVRERGLVLHDGHGHYLAFSSDDPSRARAIFYGDGKTFHLLRIVSARASTKRGARSKEWQVADPRIASALSFATGGGAVATCGARTTVLRALATDTALALVAEAEFHGPRFDRIAYQLARDGTSYYYVDQARAPAGNTDFRVYAGKRGKMTLLELTGFSSDTAGSVFRTKAGTLTVEPNRVSWQAKAKKLVELKWLEVDANRDLIFGDLGVYTGVRFGAPCDDL